MSLTQAQVKNLFDYREDGELIWRVCLAFKTSVGDVAGCVHIGNGIKYVGISGSVFLTHRIIFLWHKGHTPSRVNHLDGDLLNNRIENLTDKKVKKITPPPAYIGIIPSRRDGMWTAQATLSGKTIGLGFFTSEESAARAYDHFARDHYGDHVSTNFPPT